MSKSGKSIDMEKVYEMTDEEFQSLLDNVPEPTDAMHGGVVTPEVGTAEGSSGNPNAGAMAPESELVQTTADVCTVAQVPVPAAQDEQNGPLDVLAEIAVKLVDMPRGSRDIKYKRKGRHAPAVQEQQSEAPVIEHEPLKIVEPERQQQDPTALDELETDETLKEMIADGKRKAQDDGSKELKKVKKSNEQSQCHDTGSSQVTVAPKLKKKFSTKFYYEKSEDKHLEIKLRKMVSEKITDLNSFKQCKFTQYLELLGLTTAATNFQHFDRELVNEFYANIQPGNLVPDSEWFNRVYIRGQLIRFSTNMIRNLLGLDESTNHSDVYQSGVNKDMNVIALELTGRAQNVWTPRFKSSSLTLRYFLLFKVAVQNWEPSSNTSIVTTDMAILLYCLGTRRPVNLALWIHQNIVNYPLSLKDKGIPHGCLITALLQQQGIAVQNLVEAEEWRPASHTLKRTVMDLPWNPQASVDAKQARIDFINTRLAELRAKLVDLSEEICKLDGERRELKGVPHRPSDDEEVFSESDPEEDAAAAADQEKDQDPLDSRSHDSDDEETESDH